MKTSTRAGTAELPATERQTRTSSERTRAMLRTTPVTRPSPQRSPTVSSVRSANTRMLESDGLRILASMSGYSHVQVWIDSLPSCARSVDSRSSTTRKLPAQLHFGTFFRRDPRSQPRPSIDSLSYLLVRRIIPSQSAGARRLCWTMGIARKS